MIKENNLSYFDFEKLRLVQSDDLMKVSTDSRILAAVASQSKARNVLDIGCGIGIIGFLIGATDPNLFVVGIDISENAIDLANYSLKLNPKIKNVKFLNVALELYKPDENFDLIVSNPPYFIRQLTSFREHKNTERHTTSHFLRNFSIFCSKNLSEDGKIMLVLPEFMEQTWSFQMAIRGFSLCELLEIKNKSKVPTSLVICTYRKNFDCLKRSKISIKHHDEKNTFEFLNLIKGF